MFLWTTLIDECASIHVFTDEEKLTNESEFSSKYFSKFRYATLPLHSFTSSIEPIVSTSLFRKD